MKYSVVLSIKQPGCLIDTTEYLLANKTEGNVLFLIESLKKEVLLFTYSKDLTSIQNFQSFSGPDGEFIMNPIPGEKIFHF